jgi:YHS domain-containing protein
MERDSFTHAAIREQARHSFVAVKLRADENQELALGFQLSGLPATVIVAPSREVVTVHQGYLAPSDLEALLQTAQDKHAGRQGDNRQLESTDDKNPDAGKQPDSDRRRPKTETQVALSGYCPVSLVSDKRLVQGQTEYTVTHEGRLYRFANLITFNLFRGDPARYVPVNDGNCPVAQLDRGVQQPGDPRFGVLFQGRLFLCSSVEERRLFLAEPARYAAVDVAERGNCPHCLASDGALVPGDPRVDLKHDGRRYWFPDESHREAFLAAVARSSARQ